MPRISDLSEEALNALTEVKLARMEFDSIPVLDTRKRNRARSRFDDALQRLALVLSIERNAVLSLEA